MRHVLRQLEIGLVARHQEHAVQTGEARFDHRIFRVDGADAVDGERVAVKSGVSGPTVIDHTPCSSLVILPPPKSPPTDTSVAFGA